MIRNRNRLTAIAQLLKSDAQSFARAVLPPVEERKGRVGWSYRSLAREAGLSAPLVTNIEQPGWTASLNTLLALEDAFAMKDEWRGQSAYRFRESGDDTGFMARRFSDPFQNVFEDVVRAWEAGRWDEILADPRASIVDVSAKHPGDYLITRHAGHVVEVAGYDKTGTRFRENKSQIYASAVEEDYLWVTHTEQPMFGDVLWWSEDLGTGRQYERLLLPLGGFVASMTVIQKPRFVGSEEYSANISV